jgi:tellurite resistance protein
MTSTAAPNAAPAHADSSVLSYLPVSLFGSVMGLTGLAVAWRLAQARYGSPAWIAGLVGGLALAAFLALAVAYLVKAISGFEHVRKEFAHPIAGNLFGTPLISLLLLPILIAGISLPLARAIWVIGAVGMTVFAWWVVLRWTSVRQQAAHATPAWVVPVVGMIDVPLAVPALGWANEAHGLMLFATAVGLFFAVPLFTMILSRLMFEEPLPGALQPTLLILVAPFSVGFSAYVATVGAIDGFAAALYMQMLFVLAVLLGRLRHLPTSCPFRVSWWAASFPLAASAGTALKYAAFAQSGVTDAIAIALLALASIVITALLLRTVWGIARGELPSLSG